MSLRARRLRRILALRQTFRPPGGTNGSMLSLSESFALHFLCPEILAMNHCTSNVRFWAFRSAVALLGTLALAAIACGQEPKIVRVEEDWELTVGTPDAASDAPQITCLISPNGNLDSWYATFELNQQSELTFESGGLQLQIWDGEVLVADNGYPNRSALTTNGEVIRWTQSMRVHDNRLIFEVIRGASTTWGAFGGQGYLRASIPSSLDSLSGYNPAVSVANSGVSYAGNRVDSIVLRAVRYYKSTGEVVEDNTPRTVHTHN